MTDDSSLLSKLSFLRGFSAGVALSFAAASVGRVQSGLAMFSVRYVFLSRHQNLPVISSTRFSMMMAGKCCFRMAICSLLGLAVKDALLWTVTMMKGSVLLVNSSICRYLSEEPLHVVDEHHRARASHAVAVVLVHLEV